MTRLIVLPQAIQRCLPSLVNSIIGAYKDTSLVVVVGILDLTATARMSFGDPGWRAYGVEAYLVVGIWFFLSRRLSFFSVGQEAAEERASLSRGRSHDRERFHSFQKNTRQKRHRTATLNMYTCIHVSLYNLIPID